MEFQKITMQMMEAGDLSAMCEALAAGDTDAREGLQAMLRHAPSIDPDFAGVEVGYLVLLDLYEVRGNVLGTLWRLADKHPGKLIALIRLNQATDERSRRRHASTLLGFAQTKPILCDHFFAELEEQIRRESPRFNLNAVPA